MPVRPTGFPGIICFLYRYCFCRGLVENFGDLTRTYCAAAFTDSEAKTLIASYGVDQFDDDFHVVTGHHHFYTFRKGDFAGHVECADVELRTVVVVERSVTAAFFLLQDINRSFQHR